MCACIYLHTYIYRKEKTNKDCTTVINTHWHNAFVIIIIFILA